MFFGISGRRKRQLLLKVDYLLAFLHILNIPKAKKWNKQLIAVCSAFVFINKIDEPGIYVLDIDVAGYNYDHNYNREFVESLCTRIEIPITDTGENVNGVLTL